MLNLENEKPEAQPAPPAPPADPFDPSHLRLDQDFIASCGVQRHLTTVPVRKPSKEEWCQVHPGLDYVLDTMVLELKDSREAYLVAPEMRGQLLEEPTVGPRRLVTAINRQGTVFIWPLRIPAPDGRQDRWSESAIDTAEAAKTQWVRVRSDMNLGAYVFDTTRTVLPEPTWPQKTLQELLKLAFKTSLIDTPEHPVLRRLRGEM